MDIYKYSCIIVIYHIRLYILYYDFNCDVYYIFLILKYITAKYVYNLKI